ncbi:MULTISPECIES: hypothetical protein [unclassified Paraburkholderia]|uniref:hypothetical protein n=1 Tax=unclassified Paraburkholderia TaxID=2615204 RepID=UPI002AB23DD5|nr:MULTISPECIES: hypothetical protein [unclassified Paraburkholderia]
MNTFNEWFAGAFGVDMCQSFAQYLQAHPKGMENGCGPRIWTAAAMRVETDDRELAKKGVCLIGRSDSIQDILLRARDGKVFIVDSSDYRTIDATFSGIDVLVSLLQTEDMP